MENKKQKKNWLLITFFWLLIFLLILIFAVLYVQPSVFFYPWHDSKSYEVLKNVEGFEELDVKSVVLPENKKFTPSHKDIMLYISTNKGLVYFNTFYKYFASSEIDLRFVNILKLENDVCALTETTPHTLHKFKRKAYKSFI